jgi:F0F1-type ATP synthase membrane subunit b/b'
LLVGLSYALTDLHCTPLNRGFIVRRAYYIRDKEREAVEEKTRLEQHKRDAEKLTQNKTQPESKEEKETKSETKEEKEAKKKEEEEDAKRVRDKDGKPLKMLEWKNGEVCVRACCTCAGGGGGGDTSCRF